MVEISIRKRPRTEAVVTQRKFFKKTARGKVIKGLQSTQSLRRVLIPKPSVLRERYLRDDVGCGIQDCGSCPLSTSNALPSAGAHDHPSYPHGHYILPDTNVFLSQVLVVLLADHLLLVRLESWSDIHVMAVFQMDLLESDLFTPPIILLQTVIEEVRHRSLPLYNRLKTLIKVEEKQIWVFYNEYRSYVCQ
jgi:exosome complex exonuclease DIS3/RRP44